MRRNSARRGLRLAGAALVVAAFAGCGTAMAADGGPIWTGTPPTTPSVLASPAHSAKPKAAPATPSAPKPKPKPTTQPATSAAAVRSKGGSGPARSEMKTGGTAVALTFDDGPDPVQTPKLLDLLAKHHVKATFCLVGRNVAAHPDLVRRIAAEGHTLCNHTWQHSLTLGHRKPAEIRADLQRTNDAIHRAVPDAPIRYLRAPGGNFTPSFVEVAAELGMRSIYWQVDPRDWDHPAGESDAAHRARVLASIKQQVRKGAIVLSHDYGQPDTISAYAVLLPWLKSRYRLVALP